MSREFRSIDGNTAAAYIAYAYSDVAAIYPITPSSVMGEVADEMSANGTLNLFNQRLRVVEMQSEAGAAGAVHGVLSAGGLATTFTASQGLLLMIPNMFKIAGELMSTVFHVSARSVSGHALSIFGDHSDVMAARTTGFGFMAAASGQEVHDLAIVSHIATMKTRVPMINFFDGFRTSHEIQKIEVCTYDELEESFPWDELENHRYRGMNPEHPQLRGTSQSPEIFFQARESCNPYYNAAPGIIAHVMEEVSAKLGRTYHLFDYHGHPEAENIVVIMGSGADVAHLAIDDMLEKGERVGLLKVRLYRPWSAKDFISVIPKSCKRIAVMDRTKEPGAPGEPLYIDVMTTLKENKLDIDVFGGRYGLSSKDFTPTDIYSIFNNLKTNEPKNHFTVGIVDDVTFTSLPPAEPVDADLPGTVRCKFWGLGADGTVGANKNAIKIIGDNTDKFTQGYFAYDAKKSGGVTISHLRFSDHQIRGHYYVKQADYVACHNPAYIGIYDMVTDLVPGGTFVINCPRKGKELEDWLPGSIKRFIAKNKIRIFVIDAVEIAEKTGLGTTRVNMVMQTVFFVLSKVLPVDEAIKHLKKAIEKTYGSKGENVVRMNHEAVDAAVDAVVEVDVPESWLAATLEEIEDLGLPEWVDKVMIPITQMKGDDLPVSAFAGELDGNYQWTAPDGTFPVSTTKYEKRAIAVNVPEWNHETCIQCNQCSFVCPHAVIRPVLLNDEENSKSPDTFTTIPAIGKGLEGLHYRMQVWVKDCTGCLNCVDICPVNQNPKKDPALKFKPMPSQIHDQVPNYEFAATVSAKTDLVPKTTVKGSQFQPPLIEFSGACAGCGETPYYKLITQLFGDRMIIGNATGCTSIFGGSAPVCPFTINDEGHGPAWGNSLFEDNAEYAFGMKLAYDQRRDRLADLIRSYIEIGTSEEIIGAMKGWLAHMEDADESRDYGNKVIKLLDQIGKPDERLKMILDRKDLFTKKSIWAVGGDGWAYDIGYGGVDHVMAMNLDINILVVDTEVYSNTGGQASKATPTGSVAKFAASGKKTMKKDLGAMAMTYGYVYVASVAMGASKTQMMKAFLEAEAYPGPSLLICYSPCINHGIKAGMGKSVEEEKLAVECGYWTNYRYNPLLALEGKNPFILDSKEPKGDLHEFLMGETRYASLVKKFPEEAKELHSRLAIELKARYNRYKAMAEEKKVPVAVENE